MSSSEETPTPDLPEIPATGQSDVAADAVAETAASESPEAAPNRLPGTPDSKGWRKLHPLSPILRGGLTFVLLLGLIVVNLRDRLVRTFFGGEEAADDDPGDIVSLYDFLIKNGFLLFALGALAAILLIIVFFSWIDWRFRTYRIANDTVEARSGMLFRQHRRAPLDRVQSVNLQRSLLARLFGLTKVEVTTGGQGGKVELSYLGHSDAKSVREHILSLAASRRRGASVSTNGIQGAPSAPTGNAPGEGVPGEGVPGEGVPGESTSAAAVPFGSGSQGAANYSQRTVSSAEHVSLGSPDPFIERAHEFIDVDIDPEAIEKNTLVRVPLGRLLGSIALGWEAVVVLLLILTVLGWGTVAVVLGAIGGSASLVFAGGVPVLTIAPLILAIIAVLFSQFNKGFRFTLSRGRDSVRVGSGLTSTTTDSIPFGRIHAIEARQPLLWRPLGWWRVRVTVAGHSLVNGGQSATQNLVLPVGTIGDAVKVIDTLLPGAADGLIEGMSGTGEGYTGAGPRAGWVLLFARRRAGILIDVPEASGELGNATLRIRRGFLTRSLSIMPIVRAQSVQLRRPMVHYWLGLASIQAHTVMGPVVLQVRGLALADARSIFDTLAATVLRVQQAEADAHAAAANASAANATAAQTAHAAHAAHATSAPIMSAEGSAAEEPPITEATDPGLRRGES